MTEPPELFVASQVRSQLLGLPPRPWEVGGWLLGYWTQKDEVVVVTHATPPAARGTACGITISGEGHRPRFDEAWAKSNGNVTFLGDWHTHPGGPASPSVRDARALLQLANEPEYGTPRPLVAIVQLPRWRYSSTTPEVAFYVREPSNAIHQLDPETADELPFVVRDVPAWPWPRRVSSENISRRRARGALTRV